MRFTVRQKDDVNSVCLLQELVQLLYMNGQSIVNMQHTSAMTVISMRVRHVVGVDQRSPWDDTERSMLRLMILVVTFIRSERPRAPSVVGWLQRRKYAFPEVEISDNTRFCRDYQRDFAKGDTETAIIETKRAKAFFFTEMKIAKQSAYLSGIDFRIDGAHYVVSHEADWTCVHS